MAEENPPPLSSSTGGIPIIVSQRASSTNGIISTESLIFQNNAITSVLSSTSSMLPQELITIHGLDSSEGSASFPVDSVVSSGSAIMSTEQIIPSEADGLGVTEYQLVDNGNGELIVVTSTVPQKTSSIADMVNASNMADQTQTITLNLEEATQLLLQQQGLGRSVQLPDGTLQILGNTLIDKEGLSLEVLQTFQGDFVQTIATEEASYGTISEEKSDPKILHETNLKEVEKEKDGVDGKQEISTGGVAVEGEDMVELKHEISGDSVVLQSAEPENNDIKGSKTDNEGVNRDPKIESSKGGETETVTEGHKQITNDAVQKSNTRESKEILIRKEPDLNSPIPVTDETVVMIKGKKCVLAFNEETQQMCAYPIKLPAGTKKRGRPKMTQEEKEALAERKRQDREKSNSEVAAPPSEQSSAAETLLELSSVGADGVRRSARKRKKAKLLEEYEELDDSDEDEPFVDNQEKDPDITMNLPDIKKRKLEKEHQETFPPPLFTSTVAKRGRGRPRRYPPPGQSQIPTSIPAVIIPSPNGQTLVMADIQNFRSFQRQLPNIIPKPQAIPSSTTSTSTTIATTDNTTEINLALGGEADPLHLDSSEALDNQNIIPTALQGDTVPLVGAEGDSIETAEGSTPSTAGVDSSGATIDKPKEEPASPSKNSSDQLTQPTVIQIPENLFPMLGIKKDPIKIGLKASERELEKLKCPKCDFQGFYAHQYRAHIATHGDDIYKCKCCSYVSLVQDELLAHFKEMHPRCICPECDFMAEHAYIIKRHMMRHNAKSCTCHICGKVYKDMYILKMHVKMVHMPAEVLFECNVCSKKFTRKAHLKRHLRIHEPEKPFKCPHCEYRGCERSDISKHMLIHEEPKHVCERCGKTFRHIKNKELHVKRHFGQRDYKCGVCDFFGYTFTDIRKHIERKHQDMKTLICDKCNKHFRSELALKEHQQVCNVMMIEQILAIPTSTGGTSQATIQIPTMMGPDGQRIIVDGQTAIPLGATMVDGKGLAVGKQDSVNIVVTDQQLGLTAEGVGEEELLELEDEEAEMDQQTMQIIGEAIMTESGEQIRIISHESLVSEVTSGQEMDAESSAQQIVNIAGAQVVIGGENVTVVGDGNISTVHQDGPSSSSPSIAVGLEDQTSTLDARGDNNIIESEDNVNMNNNDGADANGLPALDKTVGESCASIASSDDRLIDSVNVQQEEEEVVASVNEGSEDPKTSERVSSGSNIGDVSVPTQSGEEDGGGVQEVEELDKGDGDLKDMVKLEASESLNDNVVPSNSNS